MNQVLSVNATNLNKSDLRILQPILAIMVGLEDGSQVSTYAMLDSGTNKSAVLKSFVARNILEIEHSELQNVGDRRDL